MQNRKFTLLIGGVLLLFGASGTSVGAQSAAYTPFAIGSSLLQPLRYFSYSPWGGTGQGNPIWWGGKILQQSTRGTGGVGYGGYSPYGNPNFNQINADEHSPLQNPNANPQQVIRYGYPNANQFNNSNNNGSSNNSANNQNQYQSQSNTPQTSAFQSSRSGRQNFGQNNQSNGLSNNQPGNQQNNQGPDPFLTPIGGGSGSNNAPPVANASSRPVSPRNPTAYNGGSTRPKGIKASKNAPFANSFIETVNTKYNGDISNAMSDPNTRDMARRLGLMGKSQGDLNFSEERKGAIAHILHDDSLDTDSKMTALKALLH